jgi:hypothetical protein
LKKKKKKPRIQIREKKNKHNETEGSTLPAIERQAAPSQSCDLRWISSMFRNARVSKKLKFFFVFLLKFNMICMF